MNEPLRSANFTAGSPRWACWSAGWWSSAITRTNTASGRITSASSSRRKSAAPPTPQQRALAESTPVQIRQILLPDLNRVDRCTTCHLAVEDPSYGGYPQPLAYHPLHEQHPFEKFGCTICHRGQGRATTTADAHGNVPHWDQPMLPLQVHPGLLRPMPRGGRQSRRAGTGPRPAGLRRQRLPRLPQTRRRRAASLGRNSTRSAPAVRRNG